MPWNMNHGYGGLIAKSLAAHRPHTGRIYIVATSSLAGWDELSEMFPVGPEGNTRVWGTLKQLLDSGLIQNNADDIILVMSNHTESVNAAASLNTGASVNGLSIIGLGNADERPLFTFQSAVGADFDIGSNGVLIENLRFDLTGVDALTGPLDVNSTGCTFKDCEFITADSGGQAVVGIVTDANASELKVINCRFRGSAIAGTKSAIRIVGGTKHEIVNSYFDGNYKITAGAIQVTTTAAGILIKNCEIANRTASAAAAMDFVSNSTAVIVGCILSVLTGTAPIHVNEQTLFGGKGSITTGRNYFRNATTIAAGTLL